MTRQGEFYANPDISAVDRVLDELDGPQDPEHPEVALSHESGWTLSAFPNGSVVWENVESDSEPRHRHDVDRGEIRQLWLALAAGRITDVDEFGWFPGYGDR